MNGPRGALEVGELLADAEVRDDAAAGLELALRLPPVDAPRPLSVTDLLTPRATFWRRRRGPAALPLDRQVRMEEGRSWHRRLGDAIAADGALEVRLRRGSLSARIDLLADVPVEIKTSPPRGPGEVPPDRPEQLEQLAAYCALVGRPTGRLAHLVVGSGTEPELSVSEVAFDDLPRVDAELHRRETALRSAIASGAPAGLGRCRWFGAGCEYRTQGICDCTGEEPPEPEAIARQVRSRSARPDLADRWSAALRAGPVASSPPTPRYRDLLYPRRAYFDRVSGRGPTPFAPRPPAAPLDAYERAVAALEAGPAGEVHRLVPGPEAPEEDVTAWKGRPLLLRSARTRTRLTPDEVKSRFPQYALELGLRCAMTGSRSGTIVVGLEQPLPGEPAVQVLRLELPRGPEAFADLARERRRSLEVAQTDRAPESLPACPSWMAKDCPYRETCGCGSVAGRSQR